MRLSFGGPLRPLVSVITSAIPERAELLDECRASVMGQVVDVPCEHLIHVDYERRGCAWVVNHLAEQAQGEWLLPLADDDLLLPGAIRTLLASSEEADVVYSPPLVWNNGDTHFYGEPPMIPSTALIRTSLWRELDGYAQGITREEDRSFWVKAVAQGARFVRADEHPTWIYRFHRRESPHQNKSYHGGTAT